jgi:AcrR family transcriptional regulator
MTARARSSENTRLAFLKEARELLLETGIGRGVRTVPVAEVARRLGRTTGAAYQIWERQEDFHHDLITYVLTTAANTRATLTVDLLASQLVNGADVEAIVRDGAVQFLLEAPSEPETFLWMYFFAVAQFDDEVNEVIRSTYQKLDESLVIACETVMTHIGRAMKQPFAAIDLVRSLMALTEGFRKRQMVDSDFNRSIQRTDLRAEAPAWTLFSMSFEALLNFFTEPIIISPNPTRPDPQPV